MNPGLVIKHNPESENWLIRTRLMMASVRPKLRRVRYRNWWTKNDQLPTPRCTSFGSLTNFACTPITHPGKNPLTDPDLFYKRIQEIDRSEGHYFDEGATADAAMKAAREKGFIKSWYHTYTLDAAHEAMMTRPLIAATLWYPSMFNRDAEGIVKIGLNERTDSGHLYTLNEYNPARGLWRIPQTWGDGQYFISDETLFRLIHEAGEIIMVDELPSR